MSLMTTGWALIAAGAALTWLLRASFLLRDTEASALSPAMREALRLVAPAVLVALVVPALLRPGAALDVLHPAVAAGLVTAGVAWWRASIWLSVGAGALTYVALGAVFL
jgi:branched-subunit amino acid transport protein